MKRKILCLPEPGDLFMVTEERLGDDCGKIYTVKKVGLDFYVEPEEAEAPHAFYTYNQYLLLPEYERKSSITAKEITMMTFDPKTGRGIGRDVHNNRYYTTDGCVSFYSLDSGLGHRFEVNISIGFNVENTVKDVTEMFENVIFNHLPDVDSCRIRIDPGKQSVKRGDQPGHS